jgi:hypothetical protein
VARARLLTLPVVATAYALAGPSHAAAAWPRSPAPTTSWYADVVDPNTQYSMGNRLGRAVRAGRKPLQTLVIADYGGQYRTMSGRWGAVSIDVGAFHTMGQLERAIEAYGTGFYYGTGSAWRAVLRIALGTNNSMRFTSWTAGVVWASAVNRINAYFRSHGPGRFPLSMQVRAYGANDIESWAKPRPAIAWARGYNAVAGAGYFNFGSCDGCSTWSANARAWNGWTTGDYWLVSYGIRAALAAPEIYDKWGVMAAQWERVSEYGGIYHGKPIGFSATLTQRSSSGPGPFGNSARQGWLQLWRALNHASQNTGHIPPSWVGSPIPFVTDISH